MSRDDSPRRVPRQAANDPFAHAAGSADADRPASTARTDGTSTEPRGRRDGLASSQGLAGAQGSGGGADRGVEMRPPKASDASRRAAAESAEQAGSASAGAEDSAERGAADAPGRGDNGLTPSGGVGSDGTGSER